MAIVEVPIDPVDELVNEIEVPQELDGQRFVLNLSWSPQSEKWYLDLYSVGPDQQRSIIKGVAVQLYYPVLAGVVGDNRPPGELILWDKSGRNQDCGREDLGDRCVLVYQDAEELGRSV